jgi:hypothetical protein
VSLLLDAPVAQEPTAIPRRRRWLPLVAAVVGIGGLAMSVTSLAPRAAGFAEARPSVTGAPLVTVAEFGPRGAHILGYEHGREVTLTVPVHNTGRLPVTITGADMPDGPVPLLDITAAPDLPLSIGAGETKDLVLTGTLTNCRWYHERAQETFLGVQLAFRSLGWPGQSSVRFDRPLLVRSPMLASCPDRKLDRQADRRSLLD